MTHWRRHLFAALVLSALALVGCQDEVAPSAPFETTPADLSVEGLSDPVSGELAGEAFAAVDVRMRVEKHVGRHRIDLFFSDTEFDDCALPLAREGRRAFLRFGGVTELEVGTLSGASGDEGSASVHYEIPSDSRDSGYRGVGGGAFRLEVDSVEQDIVAGRINVCFDDGQGSCLSGSFTARPCRGPIDGLAVRETELLGEPEALALEAPSEPNAQPDQED